MRVGSMSKRRITSIIRVAMSLAIAIALTVGPVVVVAPHGPRTTLALAFVGYCCVIIGVRHSRRVSEAAATTLAVVLATNVALGLALALNIWVLPTAMLSQGLILGLAGGMRTADPHFLRAPYLRGEFQRACRFIRRVYAVAIIFAVVATFYAAHSPLPSLYIALIFLADAIQYIFAFASLFLGIWIGGLLGERILRPAFGQLFAAMGCLAVAQKAIAGLVFLYVTIQRRG
jgi:hypothetical protein